MILIDKAENILRKTLLSSLEDNSEMNRNIRVLTDEQTSFIALRAFGVLHILTLVNYPLSGALSVTIAA